MEYTHNQILSSIRYKIKKIKANIWQLEWQNKSFLIAMQIFLNLGFKLILKTKLLFKLRLKKRSKNSLLQSNQVIVTLLYIINSLDIKIQTLAAYIDKNRCSFIYLAMYIQENTDCTYSIANDIKKWL